MIRVVHPGSRIRMLTFNPSRIPDPDPGVKKAPDPGSATLDVGILLRKFPCLKSLEDHHDGDEEELLAEGEHELGGAGVHVVQHVLRGGQVPLPALQQHAQVAETCPAILPARSLHR